MENPLEFHHLSVHPLQMKNLENNTTHTCMPRVNLGRGIEHKTLESKPKSRANDPTTGRVLKGF